MSETADLAFQAHILPQVSRTFALTIPQLPPELDRIVSNAYLLCRLADTIEDDPELDSTSKSAFMSEYLDAVSGKTDADDFARRLTQRMSKSLSAAEHELVANTATVLRVTSGFSPIQRQAVERCVTTMGRGMPEFQHHKTLDGLATLEDLDRYCYFVAGVVGEMLTDLFCDHCESLAPHHENMMALAVCFGQGLQMTNILKDVWEDREIETCWLPRNVFSNIEGGLSVAIQDRNGQAMQEGISELVAIAHAYLRSALEYTQLIPKKEAGLRRFCLWAIGMALLTLQKIHNNPGYRNGQEVKISRRAVKTTIAGCNLALYSNRALDLLFSLASRGLPLPRQNAACPPPGARLASDRLH